MNLPQPLFPSNQLFVRITAWCDGSYVEFDFAVGDPAIAVGLIMDCARSGSFCHINEVRTLGGGGVEFDRSREHWRFAGQSACVARRGPRSLRKVRAGDVTEARRRYW
ncbi:hypothetical protein GNZ12_38095 [Paraburkholderia sp. 1N]|uniref:Uncharacterized protein n=1 Tax=Paraburkholderia solitsugae TaxID=2675748 RepID=A0ABX2C253_9BURK|nr:phenol hydroxylase subunit [Paraburkholderia solitsugae]NPT47009.1 hypothetical protein [Paraburkholderia solitsugae]